MHHQPETPPVLDQSFPTDPTGLPEAAAPPIVELADGDTLNLHVAPVAKRLNDGTVRMLGYNGSIPGPTLHVQQGSEVIVNVTNDGDLDTTVHWHGLRLENKCLKRSLLPVRRKRWRDTRPMHSMGRNGPLQKTLNTIRS